MEVASPLTFPHGQAGTKRPFVFSPATGAGGEVVVAGAAEAMDHDCHEFGHQSKRRRRFGADESNTNGGALGAFPAFASTGVGPASFSSPSKAGVVASHAHGSTSLKRCRVDALESSSCSSLATWNQTQAQQKVVDELRRLVDHQSAEIDRLTSEKDEAVSQRDALRTDHSRIEAENKILKKAVTIQQERQNGAAAELEAARRYKEEADERIRRLEQMNLALQYRLQAQEPCNGNDFMGFSPRPPDVY